MINNIGFILLKVWSYPQLFCLQYFIPCLFYCRANSLKESVEMSCPFFFLFNESCPQSQYCYGIPPPIPQELSLEGLFSHPA